jgi:hypothetical protein
MSIFSNKPVTRVVQVGPNAFVPQVWTLFEGWRGIDPRNDFRYGPWSEVKTQLEYCAKPTEAEARAIVSALIATLEKAAMTKRVLLQPRWPWWTR